MTVDPGSVTVGIDIGTTAVKAVAVDESGTVLARSRVPHRLMSPAPDLLEHDAGRAWRRGPLQALAAVRAPGDALDGVCVCAMVPSLTAVDRRGRPRAPGLLYGDGRGRGALAGEGEPAGGSETSGIGDTMPDAEGFLRWAAAGTPDAYGYWPAQAVANFALSGVAAIDSGVAMMSGSLLSAGQWDVGKLRAFGVDAAQMPLIVNMGARAGTVTGTEAALAGGTVDALCDQIVSGADNAGDVLVICGATLIVWAVVDEHIDAPGVWTIPHTVPGKMLVGGPSNAGALFVDWARSLLHGTRRPPLSRRPGAGGGEPDPQQPPRRGHPDRVPVWTPYLRGERVPYNDTSLRSSLQGLDITHDAGALERAAYEASGFVIRHMLDLGQIKARRIVASGGGTRVTAWMQAMADACGLPVDVVAVHEGSALGAAYVARMAAGLEQSFDGARRWARVGFRVEPDAVWQEAADKRYERFRALGPTR
ncbi:MAG TPA: FGGY-family carbohydrate kinase [Acidimicrobiales bacterium]